ncbi:MAG: hypothetical protein NC215_00320 [Ruminococcus sp.]|nr:hypothetical protein [Ruminococcus sp.]
MRALLAKNPKQLDLCLRLLYAENIKFTVKVCENEKCKIVYSIYVKANAETFQKLEEKYRILTQ